MPPVGSAARRHFQPVSPPPGADIDIPFLPGNQFQDVFKGDYRKTHLLGYKNGYTVPRDMLTHASGFPQTETELRHLIESSSVAPDLQYGGKISLARPPTQPAFIPSFVMYDKVVLRFRAYFKQTMHDSVEQYLLRQVMILYYLEDDSIAVTEPPKENSGILQGVLIKRQRLPKNSTEFYTIADFNHGANVTFYGKTFHICDCDEFTANYMRDNLNMTLNPPEPMPVDKYLSARVRPVATHPSAPREDKLCKFLQHDRHVLRFYCVWDDGGELREFVMHYYLVDDCVEVREVHKPNDGRDPCPLLLKRQQLPKAFHELTDLTEGKYYNWRDFRTGGVVNVLNRRFVIRDCDDFTRKFYKDNLSVDLVPLKMSAPPPPEIKREYPPYNGFGSEEDSLQSCQHLVLQPPKKEFLRLVESRVLRFVAVMDSRHREDKTRKFVISVHVPEDMVSIYEPPQRNNGTLGGKFLEKTKVLFPGFSRQHPKYYTASDFFVGGVVTMHAHTFQLLDADEAVYTYMEANSDKYPVADVNRVLAKVHAAGLWHALMEVLGAPGEEPVPLDAFKRALLLARPGTPAATAPLVLHEVITVYRHQVALRDAFAAAAAQQQHGYAAE
ncbi:EF-hand domain-containing protein 1 [Allomyces javanicus]|nr:EF-hand domain-containing protein 1 [Allomyces javanicus]